MKKIIYCCVFFALSTFAALAQTKEANVLAAFKAGDDAMIAYDADLTKDQSGKELIQKFAQSMVFTRQNGKWLCESVQVTFVNPMGK